MRRSSFLALALLALTSAATGALGQTAWPTRQPIKLIIPLSPGSAIDAVARPVTQDHAGPFCTMKVRLARDFCDNWSPNSGPVRRGSLRTLM